jgi:hypothetical protein
MNLPRKQTPKSCWGRIEETGTGQFLYPPTHPHYSFSVASSFVTLSLESAAKCNWLNEETRQMAARLLADWQRLPLAAPEVQTWIQRVMRYFKNCYKNPAKDWTVSFLQIRPERDAISWQDQHAGVHWIQQFYPEFELRNEHIAE